MLALVVRWRRSDETSQRLFAALLTPCADATRSEAGRRELLDALDAVRRRIVARSRPGVR
jgi:hypothetical protein